MARGLLYGYKNIKNWHNIGAGWCNLHNFDSSPDNNHDNNFDRHLDNNVEKNLDKTLDNVDNVDVK